MTEGTTGAGGGSDIARREALFAKEEQKAQQDFEQQLKMMDLQRQVNANNTFITAMSTLEKGKDDVLRAIANNLK